MAWGLRCRCARCEDCHPLWVRDVAVTFHANLAGVGQVRMVVFTAPGADVLPWDRSKCVHASSERCSGKLGCRVQEQARDDWEATLDARWALMREALTQRLRRRGVRRMPYLAFADEDQLRGVWHRHVLLEEGLAAMAWQKEAEELAPLYGFGEVRTRGTEMQAERCAEEAAGYVAGKVLVVRDATAYLTMRDKGEASMAARVKRTAGHRRAWWISPRLSKRSGVTMRAQRKGRALWAWYAGVLKSKPKPDGFACRGGVVTDLRTGEIVCEDIWGRAPPEDLREARAS